MVLTANTQPSSNQKQPTTAGELLLRFSNEKRASETPEKAKNEIEMVGAALRRTLIPALGGPEPMGSRSTPKEVEVANRFLFTIPLEKFRNAEELQEGYFENTAANREFRRRHRCALNKLLNWTKDKGWLGEQLSAEPQSSNSEKKSIPYYKYRSSDRTNAEAFTLGKIVETEDGIEIILRDLNLQDAEGKPVPTQGLSLSTLSPSLHQELNELFQFLRNGLKDELRPISVICCLQEVCRQLGKRLRQGLPLSSLSLGTLVKLIQIQIPIPKIDKDKNAFYEVLYQKWVTEEEAKREAKKLVEAVERDFQSRGVKGFGESKKQLHPVSKVSYITAWISLTKFVFREQTDSTEYDDYADIPAVRALRKLQCKFVAQAKNAERVFNRTRKSIPWTDFLSCVEKLRHQARAGLNEAGEELSKVEKAMRLQKFVLLSLFSLIPPLRQRTFRELQVGRTLFKGIMTEQGFLPTERMSNPEDARWYVCLTPADYKTGKTYGSWHGEIPDFRYSDGSSFYEYLQDWLYCQRQHLNPKHPFVFSQKGGKPLTVTNLCKLVKCTLYNLSGVAVPPQALRSMFVTYLKRIGASDAVCDACALAMQHSRKMQNETYNDQLKAEKLAPAFAQALSIVQSSLGEKNSP